MRSGLEQKRESREGKHNLVAAPVSDYQTLKQRSRKHSCVFHSVFNPCFQAVFWKTLQTCILRRKLLPGNPAYRLGWCESSGHNHLPHLTGLLRDADLHFCPHGLGVGRGAFLARAVAWQSVFCCVGALSFSSVHLREFKENIWTILNITIVCSPCMTWQEKAAYVFREPCSPMSNLCDHLHQPPHPDALHYHASCLSLQLFIHLCKGALAMQRKQKIFLAVTVLISKLNVILSFPLFPRSMHRTAFGSTWQECMFSVHSCKLSCKLGHLALRV